MLNPEQIKRREHTGLGLLALGSAMLLTGLVCLLFAVPAGLWLVLSAVLGVGGVAVLCRILNVIEPSELGVSE